MKTPALALNADTQSSFVHSNALLKYNACLRQYRIHSCIFLSDVVLLGEGYFTPTNECRQHLHAMRVQHVSDIIPKCIASEDTIAL